MADYKEATKPDPEGRGGLGHASDTLGRLLWGLVKRFYAVGLMGLVLWLSWRAFYYLVSALILPAEPPPQIVDLPIQLDRTALTRSGRSFAGLQATENPRTPLSHYHRMQNWYQPDSRNGCIQPGCHAPLPHGKNKATRAFLNMHATSLHCSVCHERSEQVPLRLMWYRLASGAISGPPALLRAFAWLTERKLEEGERFTAEDQERIGSLLRAASEESDGNPVLRNLAEHLVAIRPQSPEFLRVLRLALTEVPRHFRGEYGAKLALADLGSGEPILGNPADDPAVREFLERWEKAGETERKDLLRRVHPSLRDPGLQCNQCHRVEGSLVNLAAAGYPAARLQAISQPLVMQAVENMKDGRPFHLPTLLGTVPGDREPEGDEPGIPGAGFLMWDGASGSKGR